MWISDIRKACPLADRAGNLVGQRMTGSSALVFVGLYVRFTPTGTNWSLPMADIPAWEVCRQELHRSVDGLELVEQVIVNGLTLRGAWAAVVAIK